MQVKKNTDYQDRKKQREDDVYNSYLNRLPGELVGDVVKKMMLKYHFGAESTVYRIIARRAIGKNKKLKL